MTLLPYIILITLYILIMTVNIAQWNVDERKYKVEMAWISDSTHLASFYLTHMLPAARRPPPAALQPADTLLHGAQAHVPQGNALLFRPGILNLRRT